MVGSGAVKTRLMGPLHWESFHPAGKRPWQKKSLAGPLVPWHTKYCVLPNVYKGIQPQLRGQRSCLKEAGCVYITIKTNHYKLGGWKHKNVFPHSSRGQKSKISLTGLKSRCQQHCIPSRASKGKPLPCFFQLVAAASNPWPVVMSLHPPPP